MANSVDPDQTAPIGAVCSGSTLFASICNSSVMLGNYLQQTTSADDNLDAFFHGALRVNGTRGIWCYNSNNRLIFLTEILHFCTYLLVPSHSEFEPRHVISNNVVF